MHKFEGKKITILYIKLIEIPYINIEIIRRRRFCVTVLKNVNSAAGNVRTALFQNRSPSENGITVAYWPQASKC